MDTMKPIKATVDPRPHTMDMIRRQVEMRAQMRKIRSGQRQVQHLSAVSRDRGES